ncbi:4Fe-4S binding protein [Eubacteriales bacterium OttesenSCG-928-A19]|nr:4Fe-4S binding protein [Eubacteriales bacterium OttesenSCG-928-A19]
MKRRIIRIDEDKCNGCGLCVEACHEGAIGLVDGKAKLLRDDYCDGLGDCLPSCPTGAITFEEREALAYDDAAVQAHRQTGQGNQPPKGGCPGSNAHRIQRTSRADVRAEQQPQAGMPQSELQQWPVQIKLVPVNAPYFDGANLLIAADCTAFAYADFHREFMRNRITIIGCPKLDAGDYTEKLTDILRQNDIRGVTIARMEVPCCGGLANAAIEALKQCGKMIPWQVVTISTDGEILER